MRRSSCFDATWKKRLCFNAWIPKNGSDTLYRPGELSLTDLPEQFERNEKTGDLLGRYWIAERLDSKGLSKQVTDAPKKEYEERERAVRTTRGAVDPPLWLKEQYTNDAGQMVCQICKEELPFKKRNGEYYFEAVEAFSKDYFTREHEAQFLALCPLCAAMYNEFVKCDKECYRLLQNCGYDFGDP